MRNMKKAACAAIGAALHTVLSAVLFLLLSACAIVCMETIWRGSFSLSVMWAVRLFDLFKHIVLATAAFGFALYLMTGRMFLAALLTNVLLMLAALIQHYKMALRDEMFVLSDLALASEALGILDNFTLSVPWYVLLGCTVMLALPFAVWGLRLRRHYAVRLAGVVLCAAAAVQGWGHILAVTDVPTLELSIYYNLNGLLPGLVWSRPQAPGKPDNYSEEAVHAVLDDYAQADTAQVKPDILMIMSESLYDPGKLDGLHLSEDPLAYTKALQQAHWGGELYVQSYGGGTAQTEYEVLTGYRAAYTSLSAYLDQTLVPEGMDSLASLLKTYGYYTTAMHPSDGKTYNRENVYARMGFDEGVFIEDMEPVYDRVGPFPSDRYMYEEIIRQYEKRPADQPWFSFVVTFQNHGGYDYGYDEHGIAAARRDGTPLPNAATYANALKESDVQLEMLVDYFALQERPVVIVIFGDHAPALTQIDYPVGESLAEQYRAHTTPVAIYSNYGFEMPEDTPRTLSAYRLGATVLHALGFRADAYYNYLADASIPSLYGASGRIVGSEGVRADAEGFETALSQLELMHYDRVYGAQYGRGDGE